MLANTEVLTIFIIDGAAGFVTIEVRRGNDEVGDIIGKETLAIEAARIALWQHKGLANIPFCIDMTEIGTCIEPVVATRTKQQPS